MTTKNDGQTNQDKLSTEIDGATKKVGAILDNIQVALDIANEFNNMIADYNVCKNPLNVGAVTRGLLLIISWINQLLAMFGAYQLPDMSESETCIVASGITIIVTLISYWRNNSISSDAKLCDLILKMLRDPNVDSDKILEAVSSAVTPDILAEDDPRPDKTE